MNILKETRMAKKIWAIVLSICTTLVCASAIAADLQISDYSWNPNPVANGERTTFSIRAINNGSSAVSTAVVTINVPSRFEVTSNADIPNYCSLSGSVGSQNIVCNLPNLGPGALNALNIDFIASAISVGTSSSTATISGIPNDANSANDALSVTPTIQQSADLSVTMTSSAASVPAGGILTYTLQPKNNGQGSSDKIQIVDNLPSTSDFQYLSYSGTNWTCSISGAVLTCDYSGPAILGDYPPIDITGRIVKATSGTITNNAYTQASGSPYIDANGANNAAAPLVTTITAGTDLAPAKSMPNKVVVGNSANITLTIRNNGPQSSPSGAKISDTIDSGFQIGTLPAGCTLSGQTVTCAAGALASGANNVFQIPVTALSPTGAVLTNTANLTPPNGFTDADLTNNSASALFEIVPQNADLSISKTKGPNPVAPGSDVTSNIIVRNNGPSIANYDPAHPLRVTDTLGPDETFVSNSAGWNCSVSGNVITCETTSTSTLSVNGNLPLTLVTHANSGADANITNIACTDTSANSAHFPSDISSPTGNDCSNATVRATTKSADLSIVKDMAAGTTAAWASSGTVVTTSDNVFQIRLRVTNNSGDTARTVNINDTLPNAILSGTVTGVTIASTSKGTANYNSVNGLLSWSLTNLAVGETETLIVTVDRNVESGFFTNSANVSSPDTTETNINNNNSSATYTIDPIADISVNSKSISPNPSQVGVAATYTISVKNNGVNPANNVSLEDIIDPTKFDIIATPTTTKPGGSCSFVGATGTVTCNLGTFTRGETRQVNIQVMAKYPFGSNIVGDFPVSHTNHATVTTSTFDSNGGADKNSGNNFYDYTHNVAGPSFDLAVTKTESNPVADDPIRYDETLNYDIRISNFGPSKSTDILLTDVLQPPSGYDMTLSNVTINPVAANQSLVLQSAPNAGCTQSGTNVTCKIDTLNAENNYLLSGRQVIFRLKFTLSGASPPSTITTYADEARLTSAEQASYNIDGTDYQSINNKSRQTTTVLPSTDLQTVSKTRNSSLATDINKPVDYTIVFRNNGPSSTTRVTITENLPTGFILNPNVAPSFATTGATIISASNCTGTNVVICILDGLFPPAPADGFSMDISAIAKFPYTGPSAPTQSINTATITPGLDSNNEPMSEDADNTNNSGSAPVVVYVSSIAGSVYTDNNRNNIFDAGEAINNVTLNLSGDDIFGYTINRNTTTDSNGNYIFTGLPPGTYKIIETQPGNYFDKNESAGSAGGSVNNALYSSNQSENQITNIVLSSATAATNYVFQEYKSASIAGSVYYDLNNNGAKDNGELGVNPAAFTGSPHISITGKDYSGADVNLTTNVDANGNYIFNNLPPSDLNGYIIHQLVQPNNSADGLDRNGVGNLNTSSAGRTAPEALNSSILNPNAALTSHDFGELPSAVISGSVYFDADKNAIKGPSENSGLAGSIIRLTGVNDIGINVDCAITTDATGNYSFPIATSSDINCRLIRPGNYSLTQTPPPGLTHTGAYIGSIGGNSGGFSGANTAAPGANNFVISNIIATSGTSITNYNFGETGQGINGFVFIDENNDGNFTANENGLNNVVVTISGTTATGQDLCGFINCTSTTNSAGQFTWLNIPGSDANGYTLTEQSQSQLPLSLYADGQDKSGGIGNSTRGQAANDIINHIVIGAGEFLTNYQFAEISSNLSGYIYIDANNNGVKDVSEKPLSGIVVNLSGTSNGQDICSLRAAMTPAKVCTFTSDANGYYEFTGIPAGTYTLSEAQPSNYADGLETAGTSGGSTNSATFGSNINQNQISNINITSGVNSTSNNFGERAVTITGNIFIDPQRDGINSGSEAPLSGVTINLIQNGTIIATIVTDANGNYQFSDLASGTYTIEEVQPVGYGSSSPNSVNVSISAGSNQVINFGETLSSIAGNVFIDANNDGVFQNTETPIGDVTINLTGTDAKGGTVSLSTKTLANGKFIFSNLIAGTYNLTEVQPTKYADGIDKLGSSSGTLVNDGMNNINLIGGIDAIDYNFGEHGQSVSGKVYDDRNHNGVNDANDAPIAGVKIELYTIDGILIATTYTDANGQYSFGEIVAGSYKIVETQPLGYGNSTEGSSNVIPINVVADQPIINMSFGETTGQVSGLVYNDANNNGKRDSNEPPIANVTINLTGTDERGNSVNLTTKTDEKGKYLFTNIAGGTYMVTEIQPQNYIDGAENIGSLGGNVQGDNSIANIILPAAASAIDYNFADIDASGAINGHVWYDLNHNNIRESSEEYKSGWTVNLTLNGKIVATTTTNNEGYYSFNNIPTGTGYGIDFINENNIAFGGAVTNETGDIVQNGTVSQANPGGASIIDGRITNLTIQPNGTIPNQSLPVDPSGVVYDSVLRKTVGNALVTITGPAGFDPNIHLLGGTANVTQKTGADGFYQYWLTRNAPKGVYSLSVQPPIGAYNPIQPSSIIPPCAGSLSVGASVNSFMVSLFDGAPPNSAAKDCNVSTASTVYHLDLDLNPAISANVLNNNLPIDPILAGSIEVTKTTPLKNVSRGQIVPYTITARNTINGTLVNLSIRDKMPAGFKYKVGTAKIDGVLVEPVQTGTILSWPNQTFEAKQEKRIDLMLIVGTAVKEGEHTNTAFVVNDSVQSVISNNAEATVRIIPDPDFDCTDILGKVFDDKNANGTQDEGEIGLAGVRIASARGLLVTTDVNGRYHITCPMIANEERGSNFILKVDERTLPNGYRMTSSNPETVRLTRGKFAKLNFSAALLRVVRVEIDERSFDEKGKISKDYLPKVKELVDVLSQKPSVLRIVYNGDIKQSDAYNRIDELIALIRENWKLDKEKYHLIIEREIRPMTENKAGGTK